jgi:hypothetical protein
MQGQVQECGCIALPEELQAATGLYPGATFQIELTAEGTAVLLQPKQTTSPSELKPGTRCS